MDALNLTLGVVVIGRNESARLHRTLESATQSGAPVVYVDSRSTDDSVAIARACGVEVVQMAAAAVPSAALARNLGFEHLTAQWPSVRFVQFVDGDCVLQDGWLTAAVAALESDDGVVAVCGYRHEEQPRKNVFHRVAHLEWQMGPVGEISDFAGDAVIRASALAEVGGYNPRVMAGEDTELSSRLTAAGGRILRLDVVSTVHDIAMTTVRQWWRRSQRGGYGAMQVAHLHRTTDRLFVDHAQRALLWGAAAPAVAVLALRWTRLPLLLLGARFAVSGLRAARSIAPTVGSTTDRLAYGLSCSLSVVPGAIGALKYLAEAMRGSHPALIEYK